MAFTGLLASMVLMSCTRNQTETVQGEWIMGTEQEKLAIIEEQLGGFGRAMMEVGYRYCELYWAGQDGNWLYAEHQLVEMQEALEHGFERRPERLNSSVAFMESALPRMLEAAKGDDSEIFNDRFRNLTTQCNMCHVMEEVAFIAVKEPLVRASSVRF